PWGKLLPGGPGQQGGWRVRGERLWAHAEFAESAEGRPESVEEGAHAETRRTRRRVASGSLALRRLRGVSQDPCDVVVCSGSVGVRGVELAAPGMLRGGTSRDPAGRNHIQYARGSGRRRLGFDPNVARPGNPLRVSASPRDTMRFSATSPLRLRGPLPPQRTSTPVTFQPAMGTLLLSLLPWALFVLWMPVLLRQRPRIAAYAPPTDGAAPLVSIIVPARNEAHNIAACVATLLDSAY